MNSSYAVHFNVDCPVIIVRGITGKQRENDKLDYRVDCKGLKNEIVMDAQRHSNPSRNLFLKHSLDAYYRNWVYGALTTRNSVSTGHTTVRDRRQDGRTYLYLTAPLHIFRLLR